MTDQQEVVALTDREVAAVAARDIELYFSILARDAVYMPPNTTPRTGPESGTSGTPIPRRTRKALSHPPRDNPASRPPRPRYVRLLRRAPGPEVDALE
jgi:hypothetical protein